MAKVIDRLRVQGVSPTRESPFTSGGDATIRPPVVPSHQTDKSWVPNGDGFCMVNQRQSKDFLTSNTNPAARRAEVLMRMRTANQGLSSMDTNFCLSSVQFVLRGKHVRNSTEKPMTADPCEMVPKTVAPLQRSLTQDTGVERQIKVHIGKARSEPVTNPVVNTENKEHKSKDDTSLPSFTTPCFMLGPAQPPSYLGTYTPRRTSRSERGFELTGHKMKGWENGISRSGFSEILSQPETPSRSHKRWTRSVFKNTPPPSTSDAQTLNQCLRVHQSIRLPVGTQDEAIKLKHFTQFIKKDGKVSLNNPYRKVKRKERRAVLKSDPHYQFDSVASYIHFNRIYQQPTSGRSVAVHIPQMTGFPTHCTDTVLLRMMLEMNKPMRKSPDKYSDVAVQRDLEEYLVVRTPSGLSKAASGLSRKTGRNRSSKSMRSTAALEDKANCTWAGDQVQKTGPGADEGTKEEVTAEDLVKEDEVEGNQDQADQKEDEEEPDAFPERAGEYEEAQQSVTEQALERDVALQDVPGKVRQRGDTQLDVDSDNPEGMKDRSFVNDDDDEEIEEEEETVC